MYLPETTDDDNGGDNNEEFFENFRFISFVSCVQTFFWEIDHAVVIK